METHHPVDEAIPRVRRLPFYRLFRVADLYTEEQRKSSKWYNALRALAHARHAINLRLEETGGWRIMWQVNDPLDGDGWSPAQHDSMMLDATGLGIVQLHARGRYPAVPAGDPGPTPKRKDRSARLRQRFSPRTATPNGVTMGRRFAVNECLA